VYKAVLDVLFVGDCAGAQAFVGVREKEVVVLTEVLEGLFLVWEEVWSGLSTME
jgi:hypothetical protein